jgi:hypothetical protein
MMEQLFTAAQLLAHSIIPQSVAEAPKFRDDLLSTHYYFQIRELISNSSFWRDSTSSGPKVL